MPHCGVRAVAGNDQSKLKERVRALPHKPGVYLMKDRLGGVLYVGKAKDLKKRVSSYFVPSKQLRLAQPKVAAMIPLIFDVDHVEVRSEPEALLLEGKLIKQYKPRYNTDFTDDKRFLLVRVDPSEELPRFRTTRIRRDERSSYFGPFAHAGHLRRTLGQMRRRFGVLLGDARPDRLPDGSWRLYDDARAEIFGHANRVTPAEYQARVEAACAFLDGQSREWLVELKAEMTQAALAQEYEKAAELRDLVLALERTLTKTRAFARADPANLPTARDELELLRDDLGLPALPRRLECFDISHISGSYCVASMVAFAQGRPDKANYRRFQIKGFVGNDDFRAMEEVVGRRYRRLRDEGRPFPDLVVIDGGKGQVGAALRAFLAQGLEPPPLIGLAKKEELVIFPDERPPLALPHHHGGLRLLQRARDEAHRFANTYNAEWRSRKLRETVLWDAPGLGKVRQAALLQHFRTIERLLRATEAELQAVPGVGPKLAAQLAAWLARQRASPPAPAAPVPDAAAD